MANRRKYGSKAYADYVHRYKSQERYNIKINNDNYAAMLTESEYNREFAGRINNKDLVYNQFHYYSRETAQKIQESLAELKFKISIKAILARQYTKEIYTRINAVYHELKQTMSAKEAAATISNMFYGSE